MSVKKGRVGLLRRAQGTALFLREARRTFATTGAVVPSGRALARAMTQPLTQPPTQPRGRGLRVLEVGPGTGAFTRELLERLGAADRLDVVEVNPRFAQVVRELAAGAAPGLGPEVRVLESSVQDAALDGPYDAVVCGLPFTNFDPAVVEQILNALLGLLAPGGVLSYFAYVGTLPLRRVFGTRAQARSHAGVEQVLAAHRRRCGIGSRTVLANVPPARAIYLRAPTN